MNLIDVKHTTELIYEDRLNEFLALGWRILEIKKHREPTGAPDECDDRLSFLLGIDREATFPPDYDPDEFKR